MPVRTFLQKFSVVNGHCNVGLRAQYLLQATVVNPAAIHSSHAKWRENSSEWLEAPEIVHYPIVIQYRTIVFLTKWQR
jgi:hypothetical protein